MLWSAIVLRICKFLDFYWLIDRIFWRKFFMVSFSHSRLMFSPPASHFDVHNHSVTSSSMPFVYNFRRRNVLPSELQILSVGNVNPVSAVLSLSLCLNLFYLFVSMFACFYSLSLLFFRYLCLSIYLLFLFPPFPICLFSLNVIC